MPPRCLRCGGNPYFCGCSPRAELVNDLYDDEENKRLDEAEMEDGEGDECTCREHRNTNRCEHEEYNNPLMSVDIHNAIALAERAPQRLDEVQDLERRLEAMGDLVDESGAAYAELARKAVALLVVIDNSQSTEDQLQAAIESLREAI